MDSMKHRRLQELDRSDFEIVDGEPDIRGWDVKTSGGQKIGEVEELILDAQQKKVRYMIVDLDDNELKLKHRKVLLPIGMAQLHHDDDDVIVPAVRKEQLAELPEYDPDNMNPKVERAICNILGRKENTMPVIVESQEMAPEFYRHDYFDTDNLYKNRLHQAQPLKGSGSEYERGLRLWEKRAEGGIIPKGNRTESRSNERIIDEEARMQMVRNRRSAYEQRRGGSGREQFRGEHRRRDNSIEGRIRDEGLRDA